MRSDSEVGCSYPGPRGVNGLWCVFFMKSASVSGHPKESEFVYIQCCYTEVICDQIFFVQSVDIINVLCFYLLHNLILLKNVTVTENKMKYRLYG